MYTKEEREKFMQRFQTKLDEYKKKGAAGCTNNEFLLAMLANMSKIKEMDSGAMLVLSPYGLSHRLKNLSLNYDVRPVERLDFDMMVKRAIITAIENIIHMYSIHLSDLKSGVA